MEKILNYIGGELRPPRSGNFLENDNPSRGKAYSLVPNSDEQDAEDAVKAAKNAFPEWSKTPPEKRASLLRKLALKIEDNLEDLARAESIDNGKPLSLARSLDIPRCRVNFEIFADAITHFGGESFLTDTRAVNYTTYSPLGPVVIISPWNLPLYLLTWKVAPALAAGNTVIAKPSEVTPMTAYLLSQLAIEAGFPKGVLNIVHGLGPKIAAPLVAHPAVKAVSFTGSTATGHLIAEAAAKNFKKVSLEMGGKNPNIIFADAPFDKAVESASKAAFSNQGQICLAGSRIFVQKPIYEKFKNALVEKAKSLRVGDPLLPTSDLGSLVSKPHMEKVLSYFEIARKEGGKILCGGERARLEGEVADGYFVPPTLIEGLSADCRTNQEEIFGPVATLIPFDTEEEAVRMANSTRYGLSASVWTSDLTRGHRVASQIDSGVVWVNTWMLRDLRTPFGGMKESGYGREGGVHSLRFFTEVKTTCIGMN